ncbi:aldehyde dehydrogenase (NAD(P)(+)) ald5 [Aspergillus niger]|nr:aldehyde dehydrogenase (NAD(P)(+)) ald5 [Aspergillus niger]
MHVSINHCWQLGLNNYMAQTLATPTPPKSHPWSPGACVMGKQAGRVGAEQPDTLLECGSLDVLLRLMDGVWSTVARFKSAQPLLEIWLNNGIFADVTDNMIIFREKIFGPVVVIPTFETAERAIRKVNNSVYGLSARYSYGTLNEPIDWPGKWKAGWD